MPKTKLSLKQREQMREIVTGKLLVNPMEDLGWMIGTIGALLDHADVMDEMVARYYDE